MNDKNIIVFTTAPITDQLEEETRELLLQRGSSSDDDDDAAMMMLEEPFGTSTNNTRNMEALWTIMLERVASSARKRSSDDGDDNGNEQQHQHRLHFPLPGAVRPPISLAECVSLSLELLERSASLSTLLLAGSTEAEKMTTANETPKLTVITSWVCEVTVEAIRRSLKLEKQSSRQHCSFETTTAFLESASGGGGGGGLFFFSSFLATASSFFSASARHRLELQQQVARQLLDRELLHLMLDGKLMSRRQEAIDALEEFEEELQNHQSHQQQQQQGRNDDDGKSSSSSSEQQEQESSAETQRRLSLALAQRQPWRAAVINLCCDDSICSSPSSLCIDIGRTTDGSPRSAAASPGGGGVASSPSHQGRRSGRGDDDDNNNNNTNNECDDNDEDDTEWTSGLGILSPFFVTTPSRSDDISGGSQQQQQEQQHDEGEVSPPLSAAAAAAAAVTTTSRVFLNELKYRDQLIKSLSMRSFARYWLHGLRRHLFRTSIAAACSFLIAGISTPVVDIQQKLEHHLEPPGDAGGAVACAAAAAAAAGGGGKSSSKSLFQRQLASANSSASSRAWVVDCFRLLSWLVVLKSSLNVLLGIINSSLDKISIAHREQEKKRLTFAWTRVPLSTIHRLSDTRMREITCFPNDLQGISSAAQRDLVAFGRALVRVVAVFGAVSSVVANPTVQLLSSTSEGPTSDSGNGILSSSSSGILASAVHWLQQTAASSHAASTALLGTLRSFFIQLQKNSSSAKSLGIFFRNKTATAIRMMWQSPFARVTLFVIGVTSAAHIGSWVFSAFRKSSTVASFLREPADAESVASGSKEYDMLRRRGRVLMVPSDIVENMAKILRLQRHSDEKLMQIWYDALDSGNNNNNNNSSSSGQQRQKTTATTRGILKSLAQSSLKSFFSTVSEISSWFVPLVATGVYQRFLSHGVASRFLVLECLNSADHLIQSYQTLKETLSTVAMHSYKALVFTRLCGEQEQGTSGGGTSAAAMETAATTSSKAEQESSASEEEEEEGGGNMEGGSSAPAAASPTACALLAAQRRSMVNSDGLQVRQNNSRRSGTQAIARFVEASRGNTATTTTTALEQQQHPHKQTLEIVLLPRSSSSSRLNNNISKKAEQDHTNNKIMMFRFAYPSRPERVVLQQQLGHLNIPLDPGTVVALTGRSGCGKSTLLRLLLREYDASSSSSDGGGASDEGKVGNEEGGEEEDGRGAVDLGLRLTSISQATAAAQQTNVESVGSTSTSALSFFAPSFLRSSLFCFVPQHCSLLPGSGFNIAENIALTPCSAVDPNPDVLSRVRNAVRLASADEIVSSLPEGLFTVVGGGGSGSGGGGGSDGGGGGGSSSGGGGDRSQQSMIMLSGGQVQRIGIARALYQGSLVLLMDEPTASLDAANKMQLLNSLKELVSGSSSSAVVGGAGAAGGVKLQEQQEEDASRSPWSSAPLEVGEQQQQFSLLASAAPPSSSPSLSSQFPRPRCVLYVTHDAEAIAAADRVVRLE